MNVSQEQFIEETKRFFQKVYAWMFFGLIVSGLTAYYVSTHEVIFNALFFNKFTFILLCLVEIILVGTLVWFIKKIPANLAIFMFFFYCFMTGLTLSVIFIAFTIKSIGTIFLISAGMFGVMSVYGYFTKTDLTRIGQVLIMGLFGIVIAGLVNLFLNNSIVDIVTSIIGVVVFTGLTAYDTQKIRKANIIGNEGTPEDIKESVIGALTLYLDFVNLFLKLLRLFGKRR